jgi:hypothetical protein
VSAAPLLFQVVLLRWYDQVRRVIDGFPVLKSLTIRRLDRGNKALAVVLLAGVPAKLKIVETVRQVLFGDRMKAPITPPLSSENTPSTQFEVMSVPGLTYSPSNA